MTRLRPRAWLSVVAAVAAGAVNAPALGRAHAIVAQARDRQCARLAITKYPGVEIRSATNMPAGAFSVGPGQRIAVPASCRIVAVARPTSDSRIAFELWLPKAWNGRYSQLGNGGFAGNIDRASLANEIRRGNAAAMTDTGHKAGQFDASWALGHPEKVVDYGYRSIKVTADASRWLIRAYYGREARRRYYIGCSNGGRQALMAAQRYPSDWDGILAGSPAVYWTRQLASFAAIQHRLRARPENWIAVSKLPVIQRAATAQCPAAAANGRQCLLDARELLCRGADGSGCLTAAQAITFNLIQSGPEGPRGERLYYGFEPTGAALPNNWNQWILNPDRDAPSNLAFATQAFRYLILDRPDWTVEEFDLAQDFARASERTIAGRQLAAILDADDPDLARFAHRGGKMIMYIGWADAVISPTAGLAYYQNVMRRMGWDTQRFFRLFLVPGMQHCQGGLAPNSFGQAWIAPSMKADPEHDIRLALEAWVERGRKPGSLIAAKYEGDQRSGRLLATQQLRPYPVAATPVRTADRGPQAN